MAYLENNVLKLEQTELDDLLAALVQTEEIDHGECVGEVHAEWIERFARQGFANAGRKCSWNFKIDESVEKAVHKNIDEHFGVAPVENKTEI